MTTPSDHDPEMQELLKPADPPGLSASFYDRLEANLDAEPTVMVRRPKPFGLTRLGMSLSAGVAAAIVLAVLVVVPRSPDTGLSAPPTTELKLTLASQVLEKARQTYAGYETLSGTLEETTFCQAPCSATTTTFEFRFRSESGELWRKVTIPDTIGEPGPPLVTEMTRSEKTGIQKRYEYGGRLTPKGYITTGARGDGSPLFWGPAPLSDLVNGLAIEENTAVEEVTVDGRPAWKIDARGKSDPNVGVVEDQVVASFDQETLLPVEIRNYKAGVETAFYKLTDLDIDPVLSDANFEVAIPPGAPVETIDAGWRQTSLENVASLISAYEPLGTSYLPEGFKLVSVVVKKSPPPAQGFPPARDVVQVNYRRGIEYFRMQTQWVPSGGEGFVMRINAQDQEVHITTGRFSETTATVTTGFQITPELRARAGEVLAILSGDLTSGELVQVANGLQ